MRLLPADLTCMLYSGSWFDVARFVHAARRDIRGPSLRLRTLGLRLLRRAS